MHKLTSRIIFRVAVLCSLVLAVVGVGFAQQEQPDLTIDAATRTQVIDTVLKRINESYVFPDVAKKMEQSIREHVDKKEYDQITSAKQFATTLTKDLQAVSKDLHLRVRYSNEAIPERGAQREPTAEEREQRRQELTWRNHGFSKVERLRGNIGYIEFSNFLDEELGADTVAASMNFINNTNALIIDMRQNGGGNPAMVALVCSYLFGPEPVHLNDLYWREGNRTEEFWTRKEVAGKRYLNKDVYVLTSKYTFSGAEEFSYNLKNLKRATIVGETTGGGAHPGGFNRVSEHFGIFIPTGRAISPITKTNWEGTGVTPDISVPADQALLVARLTALKKSSTTLTNPDFKAVVDDEIQKLEKELAALKAKA
ncbi:MAG TPA: S41 family peptidase [Pyrinomonadaceae bacterium]|jgi:C-terminal processing protease CtpA/Prc|nr:S41 family peptidase [Pyrinomonadaceae bacterium]